MTEIRNSLSVRGPVDEVFDIVTTVKYWPRWFHATYEVGGQTERPARLGDEMYERVKVGLIKGAMYWIVSECDRPRRWVIDATRIAMPLGMSRGKSRICYELEQAGDEARMTRSFTYHMPNAFLRFFDWLYFARSMRAQSATGVTTLQKLVQKQLDR